MTGGSGRRSPRRGGGGPVAGPCRWGPRWGAPPLPPEGQRRTFVVKGVALMVAAAALLSACGGGQPDRMVEPVAASQTDRLIASNQALLRAAPYDMTALAALAAAYLQKVREGGDPAYYPKAEALLVSTLKLQPDNGEALIQMGALSLGRHRFRDALDWGDRAIAVDPYSARALGVAGDAQIELGRYD